MPPRSLPADFPGGRVEGDNKLGVEAVATKNEEIVEEDRRAAGAVLWLVFQGLLPEDSAFAVETGSAIETEMNVDPVSLNDSRGGSEGVLLVDAGTEVLDAKDLNIGRDSAAVLFDAEEAQAGAVVGSGSDPDVVPGNGWA